MKTPDPLFLERLERIIPADRLPSVIERFSLPRPGVLRINTLKWDLADGINFLEDAGGKAVLPGLLDGIFLFPADKNEDPRLSAFATEGKIYWQDASSLLPAVVLASLPGENVLDLCAAPGSKSTQIAAMMKGDGKIVAVEVVRDRFFKLRSVVAITGASQVQCLCMDGRRYQPRDGLFDRILVDAPCSSEGRFNLAEPKSLAYWSLRKIREMAHKQKGLLLNASRSLKPGGTLVYATCTFAPEENESVIDWFLRKSAEDMALCPIDLPGVPAYPVVSFWNNKAYRHDLSLCRRILPEGIFSGFFIAKFQKARDQ